MERSAYTLLKDMESSWWYRGRTRAVAAALKHAQVPTVDAVLDYGAGYGGMLQALSSHARTVDAFEPDEAARNIAVARGYCAVHIDEGEALSRSYDLICLFDVLEHIEDDRAFLARAHESLPAGARLVLTVPAFMSLWSVHDVEHHHFRRYTVRSLKELLIESGYEVEYASYWNSTLLLPAALFRLLGRSGEGGLTPHPFVNAVLTLIVRIEAMVLRYVPLPFGLSVVVVARKRGGATTPA